MPYLPDLIPKESKIIPEYIAKQSQLLPKAMINQRLVVEGNVKNSALPYDRIRNIIRRTDGIQVQKDKGKDPVLKLAGDETGFMIILKKLTT